MKEAQKRRRSLGVSKTIEEEWWAGKLLRINTNAPSRGTERNEEEAITDGSMNRKSFSYREVSVKRERIKRGRRKS